MITDMVRDDSLTVTNFLTFVKQIYPKELTMNKDNIAHDLDLNIAISR